MEAEEGRLFSPLAFTKTYAMAAAAGLTVTLTPVLMEYLIRVGIPDEQKNPLNRVLIALYRPLLECGLRFPKTTLLVAGLNVAVTVWPMTRLGGEFMPQLDEGDLLYMPSALPRLSAGKVAELLQQTDRLIKTVPEVHRVFGKAGRAETATDSAPHARYRHKDTGRGKGCRHRPQRDRPDRQRDRADRQAYTWCVVSSRGTA